MSASPRGAAPVRVAADGCEGRGFRAARSFALISLSIAALFLGMRSEARAQAPERADSTIVDSLPVPVPIRTPPSLAEATSHRGISLTEFDEPAYERRADLPFRAVPPRTEYPQVSVGLGAGYFATGFRGAGAAFRAVEDSIRRTGYAVPEGSTPHGTAVYVVSLNVIASPRYGATLQVGESGDQDTDIHLAGGLVWARWLPAPMPGVAFAAGLGAGACHLRLTRRYSAIISPVIGGTYTTLEYIRFEGGGAYGTVAGRVSLQSSAHSAFEGMIQYVGMGDASGEVDGAGRQSINASGVVAGLSYLIVF